MSEAGPHVLVLDPAATRRAYLSRHLSSCGWDVLAPADPRAALPDDVDIALVAAPLVLDGVRVPCPVVAVAESDADQPLLRLLAAGAVAVVHHGHGLQQVAETVAAVHHDAAFLTPPQVSVVLQAWRDALAAAQPRSVALTRRETEVLQGLAAGDTAARTGRRLGLSGKTIENHRASLLRKLGARTPAHAVVLAQEAGLLRT